MQSRILGVISPHATGAEGGCVGGTEGPTGGQVNASWRIREIFGGHGRRCHHGPGVYPIHQCIKHSQKRLSRKSSTARRRRACGEERKLPRGPPTARDAVAPRRRARMGGDIAGAKAAASAASAAQTSTLSFIEAVDAFTVSGVVPGETRLATPGRGPLIEHLRAGASRACEGFKRAHNHVLLGGGQRRD